MQPEAPILWLVHLVLRPGGVEARAISGAATESEFAGAQRAISDNFEAAAAAITAALATAGARQDLSPSRGDPPPLSRPEEPLNERRVNPMHPRKAQSPQPPFTAEGSKKATEQHRKETARPQDTTRTAARKPGRTFEEALLLASGQRDRAAALPRSQAVQGGAVSSWRLPGAGGGR